MQTETKEQTAVQTSDRIRQVLVLLLAIGQAVIGPWSNAAMSPGNSEVSNSFSTYFVPAGLTFAVWGYLYLVVIAYGIYQLLPQQTTRPIHRAIGPWVALGCAASLIWPAIFATSGLFGTPDFQIGPMWLSAVTILVLLVSLILVVNTLIQHHARLSRLDQWLIALPFYSYLAWASVATVANVTTLLIALGWSGETNGALWSTVMIVVAAAITVGVAWVSRSKVGIGGFVAVIVWALVGIYLGNSDKSMLVGIVALSAAAVVALVGVWRMIQAPPATPSAYAGA
jgi:hypothetical protein